MRRRTGYARRRRSLTRTPRGDARLRPLAPFAQEILAAGGVVAYLREHGDFPIVG